jgi:hypothetical protein
MRVLIFALGAEVVITGMLAIIVAVRALLENTRVVVQIVVLIAVRGGTQGRVLVLVLRALVGITGMWALVVVVRALLENTRIVVQILVLIVNLVEAPFPPGALQKAVYATLGMRVLLIPSAPNVMQGMPKIQ